MQNKVNVAVSNKSKLRGGGEVIVRGSILRYQSHHHHIQKNTNLSTFATFANKAQQLANPSQQEWSATKASNTGSSSEQPSLYEEEVEMAGDIRILDGKKHQRRLWTTRDRSAMSVHFLKANLAEEGCEEAQLDVAKKLLQDSKDPHLLESSQENARLAVYWLVKSAEQGNVAATKLLKDCLDSGNGITAQNILDVKSCVNTLTNEKLTYKAAKLLYLKLNNGEEFITTTQLLSRIHTLAKKKVVHHVEENEEGQESLDSTLSVKDEEGENLPDVALNETFTKFEPQKSSSPSPSTSGDAEVLDKSDVLQFDNYHFSQEGEKLTLKDLLNAAASFNSGKSPQPAINSLHKELGRHHWNFWSPWNASILQFLVLAVLSGAINRNSFALFIATYASVWASFNLLGWRKQHLNFKDWSMAFGSIQHEKYTWSDQEADNIFLTNSLFPCLATLFGSLLIILLLDDLNVLKLVTGVLVGYSLLRGAIFTKTSAIRIIIFIATFYAFQCFTISGKEWDLDKHLFLEYLSPISTMLDGVDFSFLSDYFLPIGQLVIIISLLVGSRRQVLQRRLPELIIAMWSSKLFHIFMELKDDVEYIGIGLLSSVTLITIILIIQSNLGMFKVVLSSFLAIFVGVAFITLIDSSQEVSPVYKLFSNLQKRHLVNEIKNIDKLPLLDWNEYENSCHRTAWKIYTPAYTQLSCFSKYGSNNPTAVRWPGRVSSVKIQDLKHLDQDIVFEVIVNILSPESKSDTNSWQNYLPRSDSLEQPAPVIIKIFTRNDNIVDQKLIDFLLNLKVGDKIEFYGVLSSPGALRPEIENVQSVKCLACALAEEGIEIFLHKIIPSSSSQPFMPKHFQESFNSIISICYNEWQAMMDKLINLIKSQM